MNEILALATDLANRVAELRRAFSALGWAVVLAGAACLGWAAIAVIAWLVMR